MGRTVEIEPHGAVRHLAVSFEGDAFESGAAKHVDRQHPGAFR